LADMNISLAENIEGNFGLSAASAAVLEAERILAEARLEEASAAFEQEKAHVRLGAIYKQNAGLAMEMAEAMGRERLERLQDLAGRIFGRGTREELTAQLQLAETDMQLAQLKQAMGPEIERRQKRISHLESEIEALEIDRANARTSRVK